VTVLWIGFSGPARDTTIPFTVNLSEVVMVETAGGTPRLVLDIGGVTQYATYASGSGWSMDITS
jgi:hypothetical protein